MTYQTPDVQELSQNVTKFTFEGAKELYLIGTAHVSKESVEQVEQVINDVEPDTIAVELDDQRLEVMRNPKKYQNTDIIEIIKTGKTFFFAAQLMLSSYQKKISKKTGILPGSEFRKAVEIADAKNLKLVTADRNIGITLKRTYRTMGLKEKTKMFISLFSSDDKDIDSAKIEDLKKKDALTALLAEMGDEMPSVKKVLIDERDMFLAGKIEHNLGDKTVAVVGAGHVPGIKRSFTGKISDKDLSNVEHIPPKGMFTKNIKWMIPAIILAVFVIGFIFGGAEKTGDALVAWILANGILSALGTLIALGHPLTILTSFIAAPITSLNPTIGAGMVAGLVQIYLVRPKVVDFETVSDDASSPKMWWKNRLTKTLLVTILASLGSSIGTFVAFPFIIKAFAA